MEHPLEKRLGAKYPEKMEQIAEELGEFYWDREHRCTIPEGEDGHVWIDEIEMINATNHQVSGAFWLGGVEYAFLVEMGDRNGFEFRHLSAGGAIPENKVEHARFALAPRKDLITKAVAEGQGAFLIAKWDEMLKREPYDQLIRKYHYDRMFAPGIKTERYYRDQAAAGHFQIVSEKEAKAMRARLAEANDPVPDLPEP